MALSAGLLLTFAVFVVGLFRHQEYRALEGRVEVLSLAVAESVEDESAIPDFAHSRFLGVQAPNPEDARIQWLDLSGKVLADRGEFPLEVGQQPVEGVTMQHHPRPAVVKVMLCYDDNVPKRPYGFTKVALSLEPLEARMERLMSDLGLGLLMALMLVAVFSHYLAVQALKPMWEAYERISQFSADASHELRNPLAAVLCNLDLLKEHGTSLSQDEAQQSLENVRDAAQQMTRMVEALLVLARVTDFGLEGRAKLDLGVLVDDVVATFRPRSEQQGVVLEGPGEDRGLKVFGDKTLLESVVTNLIDNALRHSDPGGEIRVRLQRKGTFAKLEIEDTGHGIAPADLDHIFERFWRADQARSAGTGSGLGLSVVKEIVEAHHGDITVQSAVGRGTTFRVTFPLS